MLFVLGCQPVPKAKPSAAQAGLIGKTKQELLACAGAPTNETTADAVTTLTYYKRASPLEHFFQPRGAASPARDAAAKRR